MQTITEDWRESDVTWNVAKGNENWQDDDKTKFIGKYGDDIYRGGNYDPDDGVPGNPAGEMNTWETYDVTDRIQEMVNGERDNYGFLLKTWFHNAMERSYASSKADEQDNRPKLTITYDETAISFGVKSIGENIMNMSIVNEGIKIAFNKSANYELSLTTLSGRAIQNSRVNSVSSHYIETQGLAKGVYLLHVSGNGVNFTRNLILR